MDEYLPAISLNFSDSSSLNSRFSESMSFLAEQAAAQQHEVDKNLSELEKLRV